MILCRFPSAIGLHVNCGFLFDSLEGTMGFPYLSAFLYLYLCFYNFYFVYLLTFSNEICPCPALVNGNKKPSRDEIHSLALVLRNLCKIEDLDLGFASLLTESLATHAL